MSIEKTIDRASKLFRHAESAKDIGSTAEAEAFLSKAMSLLTEAGLDETALRIDETDDTVRKTKLDAMDYLGSRPSRMQTWYATLAQTVARAHGCMVYYCRGGASIWFVGADQDRELAILAFRKLYKVAVDLSKHDFDDAKKRRHLTRAQKINYRKVWYSGFVAGLAESLRAEKKKIEAAHGETGLMVISDKLARVEDFLAGKTRKSRNRGASQNGSGAFEAGHAAGTSMQAGSTKKLT